jgi:hypothetical protein
MAARQPNPGSETTTTYRVGNNTEWTTGQRISDLVDSAKVAREFYGSRNLPSSAFDHYVSQAVELFKNRHK